MITAAEITMRDGRIAYETVMFPNNPYWAHTIFANPHVASVRQVPHDAPRHRNCRERGW